MKRRCAAITQIEALFNQPLEQLTIDDCLEGLRAKGLSYRAKLIKSGDMLELFIYPQNPVWQKLKGSERIASAATREAQEKMNQKNRQRRISRLIHANFGTKDTWATLTYETPPENMEDANRQLKNFIARLRYHVKKLGLDELKYIYVTEQTVNEATGRVHIHHHIVTNFRDRNKMEDLWGNGRAQTRRIQPEGDGSMEGMARYLAKPETKTSTRKSQKSYATSKNLKQPEVRVNDTRIPGTNYRTSKRRVTEIVNNHNLLYDIVATHIPGFMIAEEPRVMLSDMAAGAFIHVRMMCLKGKMRL